MSEAMLQEVTLAERERFVKNKIDQFNGYRKEKESDERFTK
jgi:hypothetical protein